MAETRLRRAGEEERGRAVQANVPARETDVGDAGRRPVSTHTSAALQCIAARVTCAPTCPWQAVPPLAQEQQERRLLQPAHS